jgi:hypothetical protein
METTADKTLEQLDGESWGEPEFTSRVVTNCHRLRRIPLRDFTVEDLRLMIGQGLGLEYLVPLAVEHLKENPFTEGDIYPGDLLKNVLGVGREFWAERPELRRRMEAVAGRASPELGSIDMTEEVREGLAESLKAFE